jgi:hypothetical protein
MAQVGKFIVDRIPGLRPSPTRGLAFLECLGDPEIDAKRVFDKLREKKRNDLRGRFDLWLDEGRCDLYFHGWPNNPDYKNCWVFKWKNAGAYHRLYGFLIKAKDYIVCVLVSHAQKNTPHTDPSELKGAEALRLNLEVNMAAREEFPDLQRS